MRDIIWRIMVLVDKIALYVPDEEAKQFLLFQQYFDPISILVDQKVFEQKNALVTLFFDHLGVLQSVKRDDYLFSRKFDEKRVVPRLL